MNPQEVQMYCCFVAASLTRAKRIGRQRRG